MINHTPQAIHIRGRSFRPVCVHVTRVHARNKARGAHASRHKKMSQAAFESYGRSATINAHGNGHESERKREMRIIEPASIKGRVVLFIFAARTQTQYSACRIYMKLWQHGRLADSLRSFWGRKLRDKRAFTAFITRHV
jgi:hypothetical protein